MKTPFYQLVPGWALYPMVLLATMATVIASQAVISGVFSLTRQAAFLGLFPRVRIIQTSSKRSGQIYMPALNWILMVATVSFVIGFRKSSNLAAAYGVAVSTTMVITTVITHIVAREKWGWSLPTALTATAGFLAVDLAFFGANMFRVKEGGWIPLLIAGFCFVMMWTWHRGRTIVRKRLSENATSLGDFVNIVEERSLKRVSGTAVFMSGSTEWTPLSNREITSTGFLFDKYFLLPIVSFQ